ncbi:hypothetical protein [Streptomyces sp. CB02400]|uniref:hypothetical protein n=1 Tax=Streptomyces sp. CB02400 TaxID=1703944 RepID=UPI0009A11D12|nr:hypothetical protein [Streptomyces sp. CB02400]
MPAHDEPWDAENAESVEYDGMDVLMAAILDEPLPARARQDPAFTAAHRAAAADITVLREQLALIGDALAAPGEETADGEGAGESAGRVGAGRPSDRPEPGDGPDSGMRAGGGNGPETGREPANPTAARPAVRPPAGSRRGAGPGSVSGGGPAAGDRAAARPAVRPPAGGRPGTVRGSRGPHRGRRRPLKAALGALVAAAAATVVVGMGWLVTQTGGMSDSDAGSSAARADSKEAGGEDAGGVAFGSPRYLACARLVAEGTVLAVDPVPGAGAERVTLKASRYYKGGGEVTFLRDLAGDFPLHEGDLVMIGMPPDGVHPDMVVVGEADIAPERVRIIASLPESRTLTCG